MDELEDSNAAEEGAGQSAQAPGSADEQEEKGARVNAAKAFFRAMYAGEEPPEDANFGQPTVPEVSTQTACRTCEALGSSLKEAEQKAAESDSLYKRMAADFDNYRRRMERDREESVSLGVSKAAEAMMPALDDLDRAMMYLTPETAPDKLIESFKLVGNRIMQCMEQVGLKSIDAIGQPFDPKYHEPVQQIETTEHPDGTVVQELRRGYKLNDRVVRPTLVNVASNSSGTTQSSESQSSGDTPAEEIASADDSSTGNTGSDDPSETVYDLENIPDV